MQYKLQVRNFIFVVLSLALLVGLASSVAAETLDTEVGNKKEKMAIAPIKGFIAAKFTRTLVVASALSLTGGLFFWFGYQMPYEKRVDNYYKKLASSSSSH